MASLFRAPVVCFCALAALLLLTASVAQAEEIAEFRSDIHVTAAGEIEVVEYVEYEFGEESRHGIFRLVSTAHPLPDRNFFTERYVDVEVTEVLMDGAAVPYESFLAEGKLLLKIGDPEVTITGTHKYRISYVVRGALAHVENGETELVWNATGFDWQVPIRRVFAQVSGDEGVIAEGQTCSAGRVGEQLSCTKVSSSTVTTFSARSFPKETGMMITQTLNDTAVERVELERPAGWVKPTGVGLLALLVVWIAIGYIRARRSKVAVVPAVEQKTGDEVNSEKVN